MMTTYLIPLLSVIALCVFWAIFQVWLAKHDPDAKTKSAKCGGCGRRDECGDATYAKDTIDRDSDAY